MNNNNTISEEEKRKGYVVVATKVNPLAAEQICKICERVGIKPYKLIQHVLACLVSYMSQERQLDPQLKQVIEMFFANIRDFATTTNIADPNSNRKVADAILLLGDKKHGDGRVPVLVTDNNTDSEERCFFPTTENFNHFEILEAFINQVFPAWYKKLRILGTQYETSNIYETIHTLIDKAMQYDEDAEFIRNLFNDNDRTDYGRKRYDGPGFRRKMKQDIERIQTRMNFGNKEDENKDV